MNNDNIYDKIQELFGNFPSNFSVLEEQINIDLQMEYFEFSRNMKGKFDADKLIESQSNLFKKHISVEKKKEMLVQLASVENVEAYRIIEKYCKDPDNSLVEWAILALQESRMLLESKLLDTNQVFISTGLGGKGTKLRYFIVFISNELQDLTEFNHRIIKTELEDYLTKFNSEIEEIDFSGPYASLYVVIPINVSINDVFDRVIQECNQYGNFLSKKFILTNVKHLSYKEIDDFIRKNEIDDKDGNSTKDKK